MLSSAASHKAGRVTFIDGAKKWATRIYVNYTSLSTIKAFMQETRLSPKDDTLKNFTEMLYFSFFIFFIKYILLPLSPSSAFMLAVLAKYYNHTQAIFLRCHYQGWNKMFIILYVLLYCWLPSYEKTATDIWFVLTSSRSMCNCRDNYQGMSGGTWGHVRRWITWL